MTKQKLTPWFPARIKPARAGWYDTNIPSRNTFVESTFRWFWSGTEWVHGGPGGNPFYLQNRRWRGLAK